MDDGPKGDSSNAAAGRSSSGTSGFTLYAWEEMFWNLEILRPAKGSAAVLTKLLDPLPPVIGKDFEFKTPLDKKRAEFNSVYVDGWRWHQCHTCDTQMLNSSLKCSSPNLVHSFFYWSIWSVLVSPLKDKQKRPEFSGHTRAIDKRCVDFVPSKPSPGLLHTNLGQSDEWTKLIILVVVELFIISIDWIWFPRCMHEYPLCVCRLPPSPAQLDRVSTENKTNGRRLDVPP